MSASKPPQGEPTENEPADDLSSETVLDAPLDAVMNAKRPPTSSRPAIDPAPRRQTSSRPALDPGKPARRATGTRQALPAPANENQTVLFDGNASPSRPSLAADDSPTAARSLAGDDRPTAAKRPLADLVDDRGEEGTVEVKAESTVLGDRARGQRAAQLIAGAFMLLLTLGFAAKLVIGRTRTPSRRDLVMLYPFGLTGGRLPNGRRAPGAADVKFTFQSSADCGGDRCLTYLAKNVDGSFQFPMTVRDADGNWAYVSNGPGPR